MKFKKTAEGRLWPSDDDVDDDDDNIYNDLLSRDKGEKPTLGMERP